MFAGSHSSNAPSRGAMMSPRPGRGERQAGAGAGSDAVADHVVAGQFLRRDLAEGGDAGLGGAVVRLSGIGEEAGGARRVDHVAALATTGLVLLAPVGGGPPAGGEVTLEVHGDDRVPFGLGHVDEHPVTQDAGIVHQDVEIAERFDRGVDEALCTLPVGDVVGVDDRLAAEGLDLCDDLLGRRLVRTVAVVGATEVVDHDARAFAREEQSVFAPDAASGAGDDRDSAIE